ncbi:MAG: rhodanese-like domain-containing protein [Proteobacteria bacterium]|nr:rhodanese-like domain-containing protein [Pseudomonadota bacterium]
MNFRRRQFLALLTALPALSAAKAAQTPSSGIWTVQQAQTELLEDRIRLLDIRSWGEWKETGVAQGAWPVSIHHWRFVERLFTARELAENRTLALICATGIRSGSVMRALRLAGYDDFVDVSEGMLGSDRGPGWIKAGLPVIPIDQAWAALPDALT